MDNGDFGIKSREHHFYIAPMAVCIFAFGLLAGTTLGEESSDVRVISNPAELYRASTGYMFFVKNCTSSKFISVKAISLLDSVNDDGTLSMVSGVINQNEKVQVVLYGCGGLESLFVLMAHPCRNDGRHLTSKIPERKVFVGWMQWHDFYDQKRVFEIRDEDLVPAGSVKEFPHLTQNALVMDSSGRVREIRGQAVDPAWKQDWTKDSDGELRLRITKPEQGMDTREYQLDENGFRELPAPPKPPQTTAPTSDANSKKVP